MCVKPSYCSPDCVVCIYGGLEVAGHFILVFSSCVQRHACPPTCPPARVAPASLLPTVIHVHTQIFLADFIAVVFEFFVSLVRACRWPSSVLIPTVLMIWWGEGSLNSTRSPPLVWGPPWSRHWSSSQPPPPPLPLELELSLCWFENSNAFRGHSLRGWG